ncbi:aminotransferase class V-fold PLP-dependent enzyme [Candidatus Puniceispirillum sp.]|jgi:alanine-glyoxylate transaminase / serine-glyoxylate transaminase / serine-pyruvate transaminase|uniref:aminotransferase class V-fold PLP-dependent enzyme n=1 Tax=Candidatus Puniceispirillum sp. TaxID=2026719 RepID=UPI001EB49535|nr:aminotransferase class V-fold PLP-dependent enzyme [Candidatus Puniceispirillum sp.]MBT6565996.1 aminotransferase class V-fold PLP-dependent enzyme [Candidatus Puniceispirillum sp.]
MIGYRTLAVPGPTNMPFRVRQAMDIALEDHRAPDLPEFTLPLFADLKKVFRTETGTVFVFPGSGTGGWEAALRNTLSAGDGVLASSFGQFSDLWVQMCRQLNLNVTCIDQEWGKATPVDAYREALAADKHHNIKAVLVCHNETATGVTSDVAAVRRVMDELDHPAMLFVDGVSSIGSIEFNMDEWGVDVAVSGSQKGFMLPTGLAIVGVSERVLYEIKNVSARDADTYLGCGYFDFHYMAETNQTGYFPYTPAMTLMRGLRTSVDMLLEEGLDNVFARHHRLAEGVRRAITAWGLRNCAVDKANFSDTVTAILVDEDCNANDVIKAAYNNYGVSLGGGLSKVAGKVFRIGHLGWLNETMVLQMLGGAEMAMRDAGIKFDAGSGVGAAVTYYTDTHGEQTKLLAAE